MNNIKWTSTRERYPNLPDGEDFVPVMILTEKGAFGFGAFYYEEYPAVKEYGIEEHDEPSFSSDELSLADEDFGISHLYWSPIPDFPEEFKKKFEGKYIEVSNRAFEISKDWRNI